MRLACLILLVCPVLAFGSYPPTYYKPVHAGVKTTVIGVPVNPDYYYSVGDDPDKMAELVARRVLELFDRKYAVNDTPAPPSDNSPLTRDDFRVVGGKGGGDLDAKVLGLFNANCVQCHKPGATKPGNVQLLTQDRKLFKDPDPSKEKARRDRIAASVDHSQDGEMPKDQKPLRPDQVGLLREWAGRVK